MKKDLETILKSSLAPEEEPEDALNRQILKKAKEQMNMGKRKRKISAAVVAAAATLAVGTLTVAAAWKYLEPYEVAEHLEDRKLAEAFKGEDAVKVGETQEYGGFRITLLGAAAGKNISSFLSEDSQGQVKEDRLYTAVSIERTDGTPMPDTSSDEYGEEPFYVSVYVKGLDPKFYSIMSMGGGYSEFVEDGVQYRLLDMENLEMFADRGLYVGVSSGTFYDNDAYLYDEATGEMKRNEDYEKVNALFPLPLDPSGGDPAAAEEYLKELRESWESPDEDVPPADMPEEDAAFMEKVTRENIDELCEPVEETRQTCRPDQDGVFDYSWSLPSGAGGSGTAVVKDVFPDGESGMCRNFSWGSSGTMDSLCIEVFTLNGDGTVDFVIYKPKK